MIIQDPDCERSQLYFRLGKKKQREKKKAGQKKSSFFCQLIINFPFSLESILSFFLFSSCLSQPSQRRETCKIEIRSSKKGKEKEFRKSVASLLPSVSRLRFNLAGRKGRKAGEARKNPLSIESEKMSKAKLEEGGKV